MAQCGKCYHRELYPGGKIEGISGIWYYTTYKNLCLHVAYIPVEGDR